MTKEDILKIKGIGEKTADALVEAGFDTIEKIASATPEELSKTKGVGKKKAETYIQNAKEYLASISSGQSSVPAEPVSRKETKAKQSKTSKEPAEEPKKKSKPKEDKKKKETKTKKLDKTKKPGKKEKELAKKLEKKVSLGEISLKPISWKRGKRAVYPRHVILQLPDNLSYSQVVGRTVLVITGNKTIKGKIVQQFGRPVNKKVKAIFEKGVPATLEKLEVVLK